MAADTAGNPGAPQNSLIELFDLQGLEDRRAAGEAPRLTPQARIVERIDVIHPNIQMGSATGANSGRARDAGGGRLEDGEGVAARVYEVRIAPEVVRDIQFGDTAVFVPVNFQVITEAQAAREGAAAPPVRFRGAAIDAAPDGPPGREAQGRAFADDPAADFFILVSPAAAAEVIATITVDDTGADEAGQIAIGEDVLTLVFTAPDLDASAPVLEVSAAVGAEDAAIALDIASSLSDIDGSETLSVTISGLPAGAVLSAGAVNGDGSVTLTAAQLSGLTVTPPANGDENFTLKVTATSTETASGATATTVATLPVTVTAVADAPSLTVAAASGAEDGAIALDIASTLTDTDGSEVLSVTVSGLRTGAVLSAGTVNGDGSVTLTAAQLSGLTVTPPLNSDADFSLTVTATSTETASGATATTVANLPVSVTAVADAPSLTVAAASGAEDGAIALDIASALTDTDGSEVLSVTISGLPTGAVLSAGAVNGDGSVTLTAAQLSGLTVTPPANSDADFSLTVTATSTETALGATATTVANLPVSVSAIADTPSLTVAAASGSEDTAIALDIASALTYTDGSEVLSVTVSGLPDGAVLSAGR